VAGPSRRPPGTVGLEALGGRSAGLYTIPLLPPGAYPATVEQSGFKKYLRGGIVVQIAQTTRLDIALQVGAMSEEVQVVGKAPLVRSTTAELGQVIEMTYSRTEDNIATLGIHPTLAIRQRAPGASGSKVLDIPNIFTASVCRRARRRSG